MTEIESLVSECVKAPPWCGVPGFSGYDVTYGGAAWTTTITLTPDPSHGWHVSSVTRVDGELASVALGSTRAHTDLEAAKLAAGALLPAPLIAALDAAAARLPGLRRELKEQQSRADLAERGLAAANATITQRDARIDALTAELQARQAAADLVAAQLGEARAEIERLRAELARAVFTDDRRAVT